MESIGIGAIYPLIAIVGDPDYVNKHKKVRAVVDFFHLENHFSLVIFCAVALIAVYVVKNLFILWEGKLQIDYASKNEHDTTEKLFNYYINKPYIFHTRTNSNLINRNVTSIGTYIFGDILSAAMGLCMEAMTVVVIWAMLAVMDLKMAVIVALVFAPLVFLIIKAFRNVVARCGKERNRCQLNRAVWTYQGLGAIKETKVMQKESYFSGQFAKANTDYINATRMYKLIDKVPRAVIETFTMCGLFVLVIVKMLAHEDLSSLVSSLAVLALAAVRIMPSINRMINHINKIKFNQPFFEEIYDDIKNINKIKSVYVPEKASDRLPFEDKICVQNVKFAYPGTDKTVLNGVSFDIPKGSFVGVVGPSGAGKTTFVDVLLGLLPPDSGSIAVDGKNIFENISAWLNNVAYVPQAVYLIDGSIKDNITLGVPKNQVDDSIVDQVLKMAELHDFVKALPDGVNTRVGERGTMLSGGQKQRIGIARALYSKPTVLVLDEATSALDNETEKNITDTILKLKGQITIISIAHRLSTLAGCDFKVEFDGGKTHITR